MTMYLPNPDQQPVGDEVAEFLDVPPMAETPSVAVDDGGPPPAGVPLADHAAPPVHADRP